MELSFIWISKFRNIENQCVNLSAKYLFNYDAIKNVLSIKENERYIPNFFGPKITNVTGIIGQNGAGKTNVLELLHYVLEEGNTKIAEPFFYVYEESGTFTGYTYAFDSPPKTKQVDFSNYPKDNEFITSIFFSNTFDSRRHNLSKNTIDISTNKFLNNQFGSNFLVNLKRDIQGQLKYISSKDFQDLRNIEQSLSADNDLLYPTHVALISPTWGNILSRADNFDKKLALVLNKKDRPLKTFCLSFRKKIADNKSGKAILIFHIFPPFFGLFD